MRPVAQFLGWEIDPEGDIGAAVKGLGLDVYPYRADVPVTDLVANATVALVRDVPLPADVLAHGRNLKLIQRVGVHVYGVDIRNAAERGIYVAALPGWLIPGQPVAEHALYLMLATAKQATYTREYIVKGVAGLPLTVGLAGKTLGLLGVGRTSMPLIPMARAIGMNVIGLKKEVFAGLKEALHLSWLGTPAQLGDFLRQCDVLSIHVPLSADTRGMISGAELDMLPDGALLINTSRAPIVDYAALLRVARSGRLGGIGLDVWWKEPVNSEDPLLGCPGVIVSPHHAGAVRGGHAGVAQYVAQNIQRVLSGEVPRFLVEAE